MSEARIKLYLESDGVHSSSSKRSQHARGLKIESSDWLLATKYCIRGRDYLGLLPFSEMNW